MTDVMTVRGPISASELGVTHSHEHILWDYWDLINSYDCVFDDESIAADELSRFRVEGGSSVVECSSVGIRTDVAGLRRISEASGVNIVLGCGWYRERVYAREVFDKTSTQLADVLIRELTEGIDGTGVRAGLIGEIGTERRAISPAEERVFRAAARAHQATGVAVLTHTTHFGELALDQLDLLADAGVAADRVIISHLGDRPDPNILLAIAERGAYLSIDNVGYQQIGYPDDNIRAGNVSRLIAAGHRDQVVLGSDISTKSALATFGGRGYGWLLRSFVPLLREHGLDDDDIRAVTTTNIAAALTPRI
jgi:predicted metal-dependent phosphotriesterase family hydrolase